MWDDQNSQMLPLGTRVSNKRRGLDGVTRSEPFCHSPDGSDRRARVWVNYTGPVRVVAVDYVRELHVVDDVQRVAGLPRIAAMTCDCGPLDPCLSCDASEKAASDVSAAPPGPLDHPSTRR